MDILQKSTDLLFPGILFSDGYHQYFGKFGADYYISIYGNSKI